MTQAKGGQGSGRAARKVAPTDVCHVVKISRSGIAHKAKDQVPKMTSPTSKNSESRKQKGSDVIRGKLALRPSKGERTAAARCLPLGEHPTVRGQAVKKAEQPLDVRHLAKIRKPRIRKAKRLSPKMTSPSFPKQ